MKKFLMYVVLSGLAAVVAMSLVSLLAPGHSFMSLESMTFLLLIQPLGTLIIVTISIAAGYISSSMTKSTWAPSLVVFSTCLLLSFFAVKLIL